MLPYGEPLKEHHLKYRAEVDGLRALAVVPVILFHAGVSLFQGGFVGVDVFFVISGYLITTILLDELKAGRFSIVRFYERRARRILPALFLVMAVSLPFAWMWLLPNDMKDYAQSLAAITLFSSNVLFWRQSGYFDTDTALKPMLHTWSLAVEEQYYLLFPLYLLLTWRFGRRVMITGLAVIALASLGLAQWGSLHKPSAAFYLLPTRAFELAIGCFVAFHFARERVPQPSTAVANAGALLGLLMIGWANFAFDESTPFPSVHALVPTVGTALVILFATPATWVGRVLSLKPLVAIGLVSYSAYLWHQPLFAFARHRAVHEPAPWVFGVLSLAALGLAWLSWRYVEQPFRQKGGFSRAQVFRFAAAGSVAALAIGLVGHLSQGYYYRPELIARLDDLGQRLEPNRGLSQACEKGFTTAASCRTSDEPEWLLWGDSVAMHLMDGLLASRPDLKIAQMTGSNCGPVLDLAPVSEEFNTVWARGCIESNDRVLAWLKAHPTVKYAVLSSSFGQYVRDERQVMLRSGELVSGREATRAAFLKTLQTIKAMGITPVVFSPTPQNGTDIGRCQLKSVRLDTGVSCDFDRQEAEALQKNVVALLREVERETRVVWLFDALCPGGMCRASLGDGVLVYRDRTHLSHEGSAYLGRTMDFHRLVTGRGVPVTAGAASGGVIPAAAAATAAAGGTAGR